MLRAAKTPSLPGSNNPNRNTSISEARARYEWGQIDSLPGIPLAEKVPSEARPASSWWARVAPVALDILVNRLARLRNNKGKGLLAYQEIFSVIRLPEIVLYFQEDSAFARHRVAGPNPMLLKGISELPPNFTPSAESLQRAMPGDDLTRALGEGRVYLLDYVELGQLKPGDYGQRPTYPYAPMALFVEGKESRSLSPVAIQCGQSEGHQIFTPPAKGTRCWGWEIAKTLVQVADMNYHELFVHLARTHLLIEAFAVATHRCLSREHPLWALLLPHFEGTLFINHAAAKRLIAAGTVIDNIFAGTLDSSQQAVKEDRLAFDFYGRMPPKDFESRRVLQLADYPYRDDALLVWEALHSWVGKYIELYYTSDEDVRGDSELGGWVRELSSEGKVKDFRSIEDRAQLTDVCAMILFTASAQHAAVNFTQRDFMTYAPAFTGGGWQAAPTRAQAGHTEADWLSYLPPIEVASAQLDTLHLLGSVYHRPLGQYVSPNIPYLPWFRDKRVTDGILPGFQRALEEIERTINKRNQSRSPYPYLLPSLIPTSINI